MLTLLELQPTAGRPALLDAKADAQQKSALALERTTESRATQVKRLLLATGLAASTEARLHFVGRPPTFQSHAWLQTARAVSPSQPDRQESDLHVISLRKPRDAVRACPVRSCWTWKEKVLGDGHDFFIPRPRTTRRLASVFRSMPGADIEEAVVLGNCKRFDVYLALEKPKHTDLVCQRVADMTAQQMASYRQQQGGWLEGAKTWLLQASNGFDVPDLVSPPEHLGDRAETEGIRRDALALQKAFEVRSGCCGVTAYCAAVAAGLEGRPKEAFNPCSARDAHIMLQLKRTLEAATTPEDGRAPCGKRLGLIFRIALEVGKAVRNPERLPQLEQLQAYGEGRLSKAPRRSAAAAAEVAERSILRPAVAKCASKLQGFRNAGRVTALRSKAEELFQQLQLGACTAKELQQARRRLNRLLHVPTLALKGGDEVDQEAILADVRTLVSTTSGQSADEKRGGCRQDGGGAWRNER
ncbi:uidB, partial [Symbiodinium sp. CCMP2456]